MAFNQDQKRKSKAALLAAHGPYCQCCGKSVPAERLTLDHVVAIKDGGPNARENLRLACYECNYSRHH